MKLLKLLILFFILFIIIGAILVVLFEKKATKVIDQRVVPVISQTEQNAVLLNATSTPMPPSGILSLSSKSSQVKVGQKIAVVVSLRADGKSISGSDVILRFDPGLLRGETVEESKLFDIYPRKTIDNVKGKISITAFRSTDKSPLAGDREVATVTFTAAKEGTADISFDFVPFTTNHSTIAESDTSKNILGNVVPVTLTIVK